MKNRYVAPALARTLGFVGFMFGLVFFYGVDSIYEMELGLSDFSSLGVKGWALFIVSIFVGFIGMAIGWGLALSIQVRNDAVSLFISSVWHFFAHGALCWVVLWGFWLQIKVGPDAKEMVKEWVQREGLIAMTYQAFGWGIIASLVAGFIAGIAGSRFGTVILGSIIPFTVGAYLQSKTYNIQSYGWVWIGLLTGIISVFLSGFMIMKDVKERDQIASMR